MIRMGNVHNKFQSKHIWNSYLFFFPLPEQFIGSERFHAHSTFLLMIADTRVAHSIVRSNGIIVNSHKGKKTKWWRRWNQSQPKLIYLSTLTIKSRSRIFLSILWKFTSHGRLEVSKIVIFEIPCVHFNDKVRLKKKKVKHIYANGKNSNNGKKNPKSVHRERYQVAHVYVKFTLWTR